MLCVDAKPPRDGVGHDGKALPELIHEAERELAVPHGGTNEEEPGSLGALILQGEKGRARGTPVTCLFLAAFFLAIVLTLALAIAIALADLLVQPLLEPTVCMVVSLCGW